MNSTRNNMRLALLAGATLFSMGAIAAPPPVDAVVTRTEVVKYKPTLAATQEGAAQLYDKLLKAANKVCRDPIGYSARRFDNPTAMATCVEEAMDKAVQDLAIPMVAVLHRGAEAATEAAVASR
jgi:UrcA family protein